VLRLAKSVTAILVPAGCADATGQPEPPTEHPGQLHPPLVMPTLPLKATRIPSQTDPLEDPGSRCDAALAVGSRRPARGAGRATQLGAAVGVHCRLEEPVGAARGVLGLGLVAIALLAWAVLGPPLRAEPLTGLASQGQDPSGQMDRYQVTVSAGGSLWDVATGALPLMTLDQSDSVAYQVVLDGFQHDFPDRTPDLVQPGDSFSFEVPVGTFVTQDLTHEAADSVYRSFAGDELTVYARPSRVLYRLVSHDHRDRAGVRLSGQGGSPTDIARDIYGVDPPDFIQVRTVRAALTNPSERLVISAEPRFLDDFRNYRDRATQVDSGEDGIEVYTFAPADPSNPFVRVEDTIGDQTDPGAFPNRVRVAYYRDGTVRAYLVTGQGDSLSALAKPDTGRWRTILPAVSDWQPGAVEPLAPFLPALNPVGALLPDRILVLRFSPITDGPSQPASAGLTCAGLPLALVLGGSGLVAGGRLRRRRMSTCQSC
jgi:hypothetical protein